MNKNTLPVFNPAMLDSNGAIVWGDVGVGMVTLTLEGIDSSKVHIVEIIMPIFDIVPAITRLNIPLPSFLQKEISYFTEGVKKAVDEGKSILIIFQDFNIPTRESLAVLKELIENNKFFGYDLTENDKFIVFSHFDDQGQADCKNLKNTSIDSVKQFQFVPPVQ